MDTPKRLSKKSAIVEKIVDEFQSFQVLFWIVLFYVFTKKIWEDIFIETVSEKYLSKINQNWFTDSLVIFLITIALVRVVYLLKQKQTLSKSFVGFLVAFLIIYGYYRCFFIPNSTEWYLFTVSYLPFIKYSDALIALLLISQPFYHRRGNLDNEKHMISGFIEDTTSTFGDLDKFGRQGFASKIAETINSTNNKKAFAIGIIAKWGKGKSIFLNYLENYLKPAEGKNSNNIIIKFNPWRSKSPALIIEDFFSVMEEELRPYNPKLSRLLDDYVDSLLEVEENFFTRSFKKITEGYRVTKPLGAKYDEINEVVLNLNRRILVIIDDVDRLDDSEVREVLRIIRNTADFVRTFFIVAYDHSYLVTALSKKGQRKSDFYLEKIFQLEIPLPAFNQAVIRQELERLLKVKEREERGDLMLKNAIINLSGLNRTKAIWAESQESFIDQYLTTLRDVVRFVNNFTLVYDLLKDEVVAEEILLLELFKQKFPAVYERLSSINFVYQFYGLDEQTNFVIKTEKLADYFNDKDNLKKFNINKEQADLIIKTLTFLFVSEQKAEVRSIKWPSNFLLYFSYQLIGKISVFKFKQLLNGEKEALHSQIDAWANDQSSIQDLIEYFQKSIVFDNRKHFENFMEVLFYFSKYEDKYRYMSTDVFMKLNKTSAIISRYYEGDKMKYSAFLKGLLLHDSYQDSFRSSIAVAFLRSLMEGQSIDDVLGIEETRDIILTIFKNHLSSKNEVEWDTFRLYYSNIFSIDKNTSSISLSNDANFAFRDFILKNPESYLTKLIRQYSPIDNTFVLEPFLKQTFSGYERFEDFLLTAPESLALIEVRSFYRRYKQNKFEPISFDKKVLEFPSDARTLVSSGFTTRQRSIEFTYAWSTDIYKARPELSGINFIAHAYPIPKEEAIAGGRYNFYRTFTLPFSKTSIENITFLYGTDDLCNKIVINGKEIDLNRRETADAPNLFSLDLEEYLNFETENSLEFHVQNYSREELRWPIEQTDGTSNPYGLFYLLTVTLKNSKSQ